MSGKPRLYVVPGSHPCAAVEKALQLKGLAYDRVDLLPLVHLVHQQLLFGRRTVPGLKLDGGGRVVGSRAIMRLLESLEPEPPLLPADLPARAKVEAAELWADRVLQPLVRRVLWGAARRRPGSLVSYAEGAGLPVPAAVAGLSAVPTIRLALRLFPRYPGSVPAGALPSSGS